MLAFRKSGFTLIELLVVISIIAVLAAILFPVFARAREKARQSTCTSNQRQIIAAIHMYAQDHEETLPGSSTIWSDLNVEAGILMCPTAGKSVPLAYVYNEKYSGAAMGTINDPVNAIMTVDGDRYGFVAPRHSNQMVMSAADGHVAIAPDVGSLSLVGEMYKAVGSSATVITFNPNSPASGNSGAPAVSSLATFLTANGYQTVKPLQLPSVVACGYSLLAYGVSSSSNNYGAVTPDNSHIFYPYQSTSVILGGNSGSSSWYQALPCSYQNGSSSDILEPSLQPVGGSLLNSWAACNNTDSGTLTTAVNWTGYCSYTMNFNGFNRIITIICPREGVPNSPNFGGFNIKVSTSGNTLTNAVYPALSPLPCYLPSTNSYAFVLQFSVPSGPVTFSFDPGPPNGGGRHYSIRDCGMSIVFLDN